MPRRVLAAFALLLAAAAAATAARAARVDVQVQGSDGQALAGAVAWVESPAARAAAKPLPAAEIEQAAKRFTQRLTVVTPGTSIAFPNRDKVRHHVFSFSPAKTFEIKLYAGTPANPVTFDRPGIVVLGCNIHDTMVAWVLVAETPWHAQTDALGLARLPDVPPGAHQLRVWHPDMPPGVAPVTQPLQLDAAGAKAVVRLDLQS